MRIHSIIPCSQVNGPGNRYVIWTQGCSIGCPGCWNPETHSTDHSTDGGVELPLTKIMQGVDDHAAKVEGVTISGGEPMQQAAEVFLLICAIANRHPELTIGMFTGYTLRTLTAGHFKKPEGWVAAQANVMLWQRIADKLDWVVAGPYVQDRPAVSGFPILSSSNQQLRLLSDRYTLADFQGSPLVELHIGSGRTVVTGFPPEML